MIFKLSYLDSNLPLTPGYLNPALNNSAQGFIWVFDNLCYLYFLFLGCKDESRGRPTCIKLVKEMGMQVCYTDIAQLKAKLERSCGETCKFCKHHKLYISQQEFKR